MLLKIKEPNLKHTFPQANDVHKVIKYVDNKTYQYHETALRRVNMNFVRRQDSYYKSAAIYLGLIERNQSTSVANHIFKLDKNNMLVSLVQLILENEIFYVYYKERNLAFVENYLKNLYKMKNSTALRRASTVKAWVNWCDCILKENNLTVGVGSDGSY
jgi:hypothetical protein